jgi:translation initiation factor 1
LPQNPQPQPGKKKKKLKDAFADAADAEKKAAATEGASGAAPTSAKDYVHIRVQQRNGRKSLTTIQGLDKSFDYKKIIKAFKKEFCCNGTVVDDAELGSIIQLQGDQRVSASAFLVDNKIVKKAALKIHGF